MSPSRQHELHTALARRLEEHHPRASSSKSARVRWLAEQLENYVERWLAFAAIRGAGQSSLFAGDLFGAVEVGIDVVNCEIQVLREDANTMTAWDQLRTALENVRCSETMPNPETLRALLRNFVGIWSKPASER